MACLKTIASNWWKCHIQRYQVRIVKAVNLQFSNPDPFSISSKITWVRMAGPSEIAKDC
jgi:hypothetical protein